jgi:four helix bundle protein
VAVGVDLTVAVVAPGVVAALVSGNEAVAVINARNEHATCNGRTSRADMAKHYTIARGSAMECAAHLDVMKLDELVESELYERGVDLLERIVAMLTKLIDR